MHICWDNEPSTECKTLIRSPFSIVTSTVVLAIFFLQTFQDSLVHWLNQTVNVYEAKTVLICYQNKASQHLGMIWHCLMPDFWLFSTFLFYFFFYCLFWQFFQLQQKWLCLRYKSVKKKHCSNMAWSIQAFF